MSGLFGFLNVNKPTGVTSRDVVNAVQRQFRRVKCGHAGTLDPLATGVMVVCLGPATRLVPYVQHQRKEYLATFLLGRRSASDDTEEEVELLPDARVPTRSDIQAQTRAFIGEIRQRPPTFSAVKVAGRRAYTLARRGEEPQLAERIVVVHEIELLEYDYPALQLRIACGSGTYIRSIGRDLAAALGSAGVMSALERTAVGPFRVEDAVELNRVNQGNLAPLLLPADLAVCDLPRVEVTELEQQYLERGQPIHRPQHGITGEAAAFSREHGLVGIVAANDRDMLRPVRNFRSQSGQ